MNLEKIRTEKGLYQAEVARRSRISACYYNLIEKRVRRPSPQVARRIAKALDILDDWYKLLDVTLKKPKKATTA